MDAVLAEFAASFDRCWLCGTKAERAWPPRLEIHHIARGAHRKKGHSVRCNLIRTCQRCHSTRLDGMSVHWQLALKVLNDPTGYDRVAVNRLRCRADDAISEADMAEAISCIHQLSAGRTSGYPFSDR